MKILILGGSGNTGGSFMKRMAMAGHEVAVITRQKDPKPVYDDARLIWPNVTWITADRDAEEKDGAWVKRLAAIEADVVLDVVCYRVSQAEMLYDAFAGRIRHLVQIGSVWAYGPTDQAPYEEHMPRRPLGEYGRQKTLIEEYLVGKYRTDRFPATIVHPGHISGRKILPIDPQGARNGVEIYRKLATGQTVHLPDDGLATLHHVHGDDIAQICQRAVERPGQSVGQAFSAVTPYALTLVGCCRAVARMFGREPNLEFVPMERFKDFIEPAAYGHVVEHTQHSPCTSIAKAVRLLGHQPRYTTEQIYAESIEYLLESGRLQL